MKVIFLDIDGVLNCEHTKQRIPDGSGFVGIEDNKVELLARLVQKTGAEIVLSSSWKGGWSQYDGCESYGDYLNMKLAQYDLYIMDKTPTIRSGWDRSGEIKSYLTDHPEIDAWVVFDDEWFSGFKEDGISPHLVRTSWKEGLKKSHIKVAEKMLNKNITLTEEEQKEAVWDTGDHFGLEL